jgi:hypothetical protein
MTIRALSVGLFGLLLPCSVLAAPYCLESQALPPLCIYYDASSCQREAIRQQAACSVNAQELPLSHNVGQFCMVTSQGISQCFYSDRATCAADATRQHGLCTDAPTVAPSAAPDPYGLAPVR